MNTKKDQKKAEKWATVPNAERVQAELSKAESKDDFFGKEGIYARLFANTLEEMSDHLGYEPHEAKERNSGNSRNGRYKRKVRTSNGETAIEAPRDRNDEFEPKVIKKYRVNTNELEEKIIGMYGGDITATSTMMVIQPRPPVLPSFTIYRVSLYNCCSSIMDRVTPKHCLVVGIWQD